MTTAPLHTTRHTTLTATIDEITDAGIITGIAVRYGKKIRRGETMSTEIDPGAFSKQLLTPHRVKILWQHDTHEPIGHATELIDSPHDLLLTAQLSRSPHVPNAAKALALLKEGTIDELSVGFEWVKYDTRMIGDVLHVHHHVARLTEISLVTRGALGRDARVLTVASTGQTRSEQIEIYRRKFVR